MFAHRIGSSLLALVCTSGCYSTTTIYSQPAGAKVVLDQKHEIGTTPLTVSEPVWIWTDHVLTLSSPGYATRPLQIRSEGLNFAYLAVCVCTAGLLLPIMFASEYPPQYVVQLQPENPQAAQTAYLEKPTIEFE